jgi:hypothetical protein
MSKRNNTIDKRGRNPSLFMKEAPNYLKKLQVQNFRIRVIPRDPPFIYFLEKRREGTE